MKRKTTAIMTLLCCVFALLFSVPVMAAENAEGEEMVAVCAKVPDSWQSPCVWAWDDEGVGAFASWPGGEMDAMEDGWYYCYVPVSMTNVIINANDGSVQTEGIAVEAGRTVWITVAEDLSAQLTYEAPTRAQIPEYVETFIVHAYVPLSWKTVNLWVWSAPDGTNAFDAWPGSLLKEGEDGWFTGKCPTWVNSIIINGNEGTVQTEDVSVEGKELWITVYEDLTYELTYEDPTVPDVEDITVKAQIPADWQAPCLWAWSAPDGTNAFSSWPGEALTESEDGWYTMEVPGWINFVIVNANEGTVQTMDLSVEPGKDIWVVVNGPEDAAVFYEEPSENAAAPAQTETPETAALTEEPETSSAEEAVNDAAAETEKETGGNTGLIIGIAAAVAVAVGAGVAVKKKKQK